MRRLGASGIALVAAASVAQIDIINLLLDNGADVNLQTKYGTALGVSSRSGHTEVVRLLIERGANLGSLNSEEGHVSPLEFAAEEGHINIVHLLLDAGADINLAYGYGEGALVAASQRGHTEIIRLLIEKGIDIATQGQWALHYAEWNGHSEAIEILRQVV